MGGNIFDNTSKICKDEIEPTVNKLISTLNLELFRDIRIEDYILLGSTGRTTFSGDIDLGIPLSLFTEDKKWENRSFLGKVPDFDFSKELEKLIKRARTATQASLYTKTVLKYVGKYLEHKYPQLIQVNHQKIGTNSIHLRFPIYTTLTTGDSAETGRYVQVDINIGDLKWMDFMYYSRETEENLKGLHRTQLMIAMLSIKDITLSHTKGMYRRTLPEVQYKTITRVVNTINSLYNLEVTVETLLTYKNIREALQLLNSSDYYKVLDRYLHILDKTRVDVPYDLQEYWKLRQHALHLTGKFLPVTSKLYRLCQE